MSLPGAYRSADGAVLPAITTVEMQELDAIAVEETGPTLLQMMENAGRSMAAAVLEMLGTDRDQPVVVLAGRGGNGGGGVCAARHLANRALDVTLCLTDPDALSEATAWQRQVYGNTSGAVVGVDHLASLRAEVIVDAIIGYSLDDAPRGAAHEMIRWATDQRSRHGARILSLDVPSGIDASTGDAPGAHISADETITLALPKTGLHPTQGLDGSVVGHLRLADLGIPSAVYGRFGSPAPFRGSFLVDIDPVGVDHEAG